MASMVLGRGLEAEKEAIASVGMARDADGGARESLGVAREARESTWASPGEMIAAVGVTIAFLGAAMAGLDIAIAAEETPRAAVGKTIGGARYADRRPRYGESSRWRDDRRRSHTESGGRSDERGPRHIEGGSRRAGGRSRRGESVKRYTESISRHTERPQSRHRERQSSNRRTLRSIFVRRSPFLVSLSADRRRLEEVVVRERRQLGWSEVERAARSMCRQALSV
jgi:hypothetical protein